MKKLFVALLAVAGLTACFNEEVVNVADQRTPIAFDTFVENATRAAVDPSTTTESLDGFKVWGFMDDVTGKVFEGEEVTGTKGNFTYANTAYWLPGHDYYFAALAPIGGNWTLNTENASELGAGIVNFINADGSEDLLYAANVESAPNLGEAKTVNFTFSHLLSKVKFTFENIFANPNYTVEVRDIKITDAPKGGSIDLAVENWWDNNDWILTDDTLGLEFGTTGLIYAPNNEDGLATKQESAVERLTIPAGADYEYNITFTVDLYIGGLKEPDTFNLTSKVTGLALEMGKAYNFKAAINQEVLNLQEIVFDVEEVKNWVEAGDVATVLSDDISGLTLVSDAVAEGTLNLNGTFDGGNNTLFARMTSETVQVTAGTAPIILAEGPSTVRNLIIDGENHRVDGRGMRAFVLNAAGDYVIENVVIRNVVYCLNTVASFDTLTVKNSTFEGWTSFTGTSALFENVSFEIGDYGNIKPYCSTVLRNCSFEDGFMIDFTAMPADATITLDQCTYNNQVLTAETFASAVTDGVYTGKVIFK